MVQLRVRNRQTGTEQEMQGAGTVRDLLAQLHFVEGAVLVMRGGELLTRDTPLRDGEIVEIVPVVSGG
jgi:sulfur carrier protein ThiS